VQGGVPVASDAGEAEAGGSLELKTSRPAWGQQNETPSPPVSIKKNPKTCNSWIFFFFSFLSFFFFFFSVLGFEFRNSGPTSPPFLVKGFFEIESHELFAWADLEP
jgi:hypothetical protein